MAKLVLVLVRCNNMTAGNASMYQANLLGHLETAITTDEHVKQDWYALVGHVPRLQTLAALNYVARYAARSCVSTFLHNVWAPTLDADSLGQSGGAVHAQALISDLTGRKATGLLTQRSHLTVVCTPLSGHGSSGVGAPTTSGGL
jgi:hypothetical protein